MNDPFARDRQKTRNRVIAIAAVLVAAGAVAIVLSIVYDAERLIAKEMPAIDAMKARYCKVLEAEKKAGPGARASTPPGERLQAPGFVFMDSSRYSRMHLDANTDLIEMSELESLCAGKWKGASSVTSLIGKFYEPNARVRSNYEHRATKDAIRIQKQLKYLLVVMTDQFTASSAVGDQGLAAGRYKARAVVYRLDGAAYLDGIGIEGSGPSFAYVERNGREDDQLAAQSSIAFEDSIVRAFKDRGIDLVIR